MKALFPLLFCLCCGASTLTAQEAPAHPFDGQVSLDVFLNRTRPLEVFRDYEPAGSDLTSNPSPGLEGRIAYHLLLKPRLGLSVGLVYGVYSYHWRLEVSEDFRALGWGGFEDFYTEFGDLFYGGVNVSGNYLIPVGERSWLTTGAGASVLAFTAQSIGFGVGAILENGAFRDLLDVNMRTNPSREITVAPEVHLRFQHLLGKRFSLRATVLGTIASTTVLLTQGPYRIFGDNDQLTGRFRKRFGHFGLGMGVGYVLR